MSDMKAKAKLLEMLAEAVRNTQPQPADNTQPEPVRDPSGNVKRNPAKRGQRRRSARLKQENVQASASRKQRRR